MPPHSPSSWSIARIRDVVYRKFGKRPCLFQIRVAQALRERRNDVVAVAATGAGKTLSFWIPLLMALEDGEDKCIFIVTPLNILGKQNVALLEKAGMHAIAVDGSTALPEVFKAIADGQYQVVIMNPEIVMQSNGPCRKLWCTPSFVQRIAYFVFDEAHCIKEWSSFREDYKYISALRYLLSSDIPFYLPSATLDESLLHSISDTMQLRSGHTEYILRSNDRPDVALAARKMEFSASSFHDLDFLIPDGFTEDDTPPPKFLIFFDSIKEAEAAVAHLRNRLPSNMQHKIAYFHSVMTADYREDEFAALANGERFRLCVTDSFGMGLDLPDVLLILQWKVPQGLNTLWQRFGRAARGEGLEGFAILIAERDHFDDEKEKKSAKSAAAKARREFAKRKRTSAHESASSTSSKRPATASAHSTHPEHPSSDRAAQDIDGEEEDDTQVEIEETAAEEVPELRAQMDVDGTESGGSALGQTIAEMLRTEEATSAIDVEEKRVDYRSRRRNELQDAGARCLNKKGAKEISPVVEDMINAATRGIGCRRKPVTWAYSNDKRVFDHKHCDPSKADGCSRCSPQPCRICCDLCNPIAFEYIATPRPSITRKMKKSHIKTPASTPTITDLRLALFDWCDERAQEKFGTAVFKNFGGNLFLPVTVLERIVLCAQAGKLSTLEALRRESGWRPDWIDQYGESIVSICNHIFPPRQPEAPNTTSVSLGDSRAQNTSGPSEAEQAARKRRPPTCSMCKQPGHNSRNRLCPARTSGSTVPQDENTAPQHIQWQEPVVGKYSLPLCR